VCGDGTGNVRRLEKSTTVAVMLDDAVGSTPSSSSSGPATMPPPSPNMPEMTPSNADTNGNVLRSCGVHYGRTVEKVNVLVSCEELLCPYLDFFIRRDVVGGLLAVVRRDNVLVGKVNEH
jgi:hypothetical protein